MTGPYNINNKVDNSQLATAATANSVAQRTSDGSLNVTDLNASRNAFIGTTDSNSARLTATSGSGSCIYGNSVSVFSRESGTATQSIIGMNQTGVDAPFIDFRKDGVTVGNIGTSSGDIYFGSGSSGTERMRIDSSGNVGINTSSPATQLQVKSDTGGNAYISAVRDNATSTEVRIGAENGNTAIVSLGAIPMAFYTNSAERMRIDSSGNVLIGLTSPPSAGSEGVRINESGITTARSSSSARAHVVFINTNGQVGAIVTENSSTSFNTSSDYRLKEDWQPMEGSIDRLMQLKPCNFAWKADGSRVDGFLAHEAQEVVPEAVTGEKDAVRTEQYEVQPAVYEDVVIPAEFDGDGNEISPERTEQKLVKEAVMGEREVPDYQGIDQSKLVPLLTAALQDAVKKIESLEARIEALES